MKMLFFLLLSASASAQVINPITTGNTPGLVGSATANHCVKFNDASGNFTDAGAACGTGSGTVTSISSPNGTITVGTPTTTPTIDVVYGTAANTAMQGNAGTQAAIVPNTAPAAGNLLIGNAGGTAYASTALSQDCTLASTGVITCTKTNNVALTSAATTAIGTSGATIPLLSTANTWTTTQTFAGISATTLGTTTTGQSQIFGGLRVGKHDIADANYTMTAADGAFMAYTSISAARTITFATNGNAAGPQILIIKDQSGSASAGNTISLSGPSIDGVASPNVVVNSAFGSKRLYCTDSTHCFSW